MIKPTPGRIVHYYPSGSDNMTVIGAEPLAAIIVGVWSDTCVNLCVFDTNGIPHQKTSVLLVQDNMDVPADTGYADWMPYQKGQAAKTEEFESKMNTQTSDSVSMPDTGDEQEAPDGPDDAPSGSSEAAA